MEPTKRTKKRVAPLKLSSPQELIAEPKTLDFVEDDLLDQVDDVFDEIFGTEEATKGTNCDEWVNLDDWMPVRYSESENKSLITGETKKFTQNKPVPLSAPKEQSPKKLEKFNEQLLIGNISSSTSKPTKQPVTKDNFLGNIKQNNLENGVCGRKAMFTSRDFEEDTILKLRFSKRDLPALTIKDLAKEMEFLTLTASLKSPEGKKFFTGGVVTAHAPLKKSGSVITITDLALDPCSVRLLLFGTAFTTHNKVGVGSVVLVISPQKGKPFNGRDCLVANKDAQIMVAGTSKDYGLCGARTKAGGKCKNFVNLHLCRYCSAHAVTEFKRQGVGQNLLSAATGRGLLPENSAKTKADLWMAPANKSYSLIPAKVDTVKVRKDKDTLFRLSSTVKKDQPVSSTAGMSNLPVGNKRKFDNVGCSPTLSAPFNARALVEKTIEQPKIKSPQSFLSHVKTTPSPTQRISTAKKRAIEFAKQSGGIAKNIEKKIKLDATAEVVPAQKTLKDVLTPEYLSLMNEKPSDPVLLAQAETQERNKRFDRLQIMEEIGEKLSKTHEVPVRAIRCLVCEKNYFQLPLQCLKLKHNCSVVSATKRHFQCTGCKNKTTTLERLPTTECSKCGKWVWSKCGITGDRTCSIVDKLSLRGLEEKYFGSVVTDANLSLLVPDDK